MNPLKYNYTLEQEGSDSSHMKILQLLEPDSRILELGCASGYMTRYMAETLNCQVSCVEMDETAAELARPFCEKMVVADVEALDFGDVGLKGPWDAIVMADILEHLKDAESFLVRIRPLLAPEGCLLISIPNGVHGSVALEFLDGKAEYRETGLLDNTHLRFFDRESFVRALDKAGYLVSHLGRVIVHPKDTELNTLWENYPREVTAYMEKVNPEFKTYQFIIKAFPTTDQGWKKGLEDAVRSQKILRQEAERRMLSVEKDLEWHKTEVQRLNGELADKEDGYAQALEKEKTRLEAEIEALHRDYKFELSRLESEHKTTTEGYEAQLLSNQSEFDQAVQVYEDQIQKNKTAHERDSETFEAAIKGLEQEMADVHAGYRAHMDKQNKAYETVKSDLAHLAGEAGWLRQELELVHRSLAWRLLLKYRGLVDRFLPEHSRGRRFYRLSLLAPVVLVKEGPLSFFKKIFRRIPKLPGIKDSENPEIRYDLVFDIFEKVEISIVIPVYNKVEYTYYCLESIIRESQTQLSYEVIVVDNASCDETPRLLEKTKGITVVSNPDNKGFVEACNMGAGRARGRYILFLNNDTRVTAGWMDRLLEPFAQDERTGITGAKLVYPDGSLQEAGNIIWQDATGWNYGRGQNPDQPEYCYLKEVDYCSGACLMIPKRLWEKTGGFDMRYAPAYYEDTDLCFSVRNLGYKVIYQPLARVVHYEGISAGTDINSGMKQYQQKNHKTFFDKWETVLKNSHCQGPEQLFYARQRAAGKTILVVDHYAPTFDKDSGSLRMFSILKILVKSGHRVIFWPENRAHNAYAARLQQMGVEVLYGNIRFEEYVQANGQFLDMIIFSRPHVAINMIYPAKTFSKATIVYDTVDLHFLREQRRACFDPDCDPEYWKKIEFFLADMADHVLVVSDVEQKNLEALGYADKVSVISNVHEIMGCSEPFEKRHGLLFIGGFLHTPNEDAMIWFIEQIFPEIRRAIPDITCTIVGSHPTDAVRSLDGNGVTVTGYVEDVTPYFANSRVFVSPLRYGAGVKGKIGQSLSYGLPVVTTPIGAEGMGMEHGRNMLLAEDEKAFARAVIDLYHDPELWQSLSQNGMDLITQRFSPKVIKDGLDKLLEKAD